LEREGIEKFGDVCSENGGRLVPGVEVFGEAADLEIVFVAAGCHPLAEALGDKAAAEMQDALGRGDMAALKNPISVTDDTGQQPRAREGVGDQGPAEDFGKLEEMCSGGLLRKRQATNEDDAVWGVENGGRDIEGGFGNLRRAESW
jgi:hypothetical protein